MEVESIPQQALERIEQISSADLVVGILADLDREGIARLCDDLQTLPGSPRIAVLQNDKGASPASPNPETAETSGFPFLVSWPFFRPDLTGTPMSSLFGAYQAVFSGGDKLGARACCVVASKLENAAPRWVCRLAQPLLEKELDAHAIIDRQPPQPGDVPQTFADIEKARRLLGYNPQTQIEEGIHRFVEWFRTT